MALALMGASKAVVFLALFLCILLPVPTMAQEEDGEWFWIMADSKNSTTTCPGRCLAVNSSSGVEYINRPVIFVACKVGSSSDTTATGNNKNQQWLRHSASSSTVIRFNATAASDDPQSGILCLQANPNPNQTLTLNNCTGKSNQQWIVANDTIKTLASNPPSYLSMNYNLAGFLNSTDGIIGYRHAAILSSSRPSNASFTTTFSMVDGTLQTTPPLPIFNNETLNLIQNGEFDKTSYDFLNSTASLPVTSDPFTLCNWQVMKDSATLSPNPSPNSNRTLLLKDGVIRQTVATSPGAFYALILKLSTAAPNPSDSTAQCSGNDTLFVNPYPSSNLHQELQILNNSWTTRHLSFQAGGENLLLAFQGCATCGCYLSDLNLIQVLGPAPFPPPPPLPSPPARPEQNRTENSTPNRPDLGGNDRFGNSKRLSNGAVVGIVVGTAAVFFGIGGACFWVLVGNKKRGLEKENEIAMGRPGEWSIQTSTPAQSRNGTRGNSSAALPRPIPSATAVSGSSLQAVPTSNPISSSSDARDERGV